jgi:hypothetical protein
MLIKREREKSLLKPREVQQWRASGPQDRIDGTGREVRLADSDGAVEVFSDIVLDAIAAFVARLSVTRSWAWSLRRFYTGGYRA